MSREQKGRRRKGHEHGGHPRLTEEDSFSSANGSWALEISALFAQEPATIFPAKANVFSLSGASFATWDLGDMRGRCDRKILANPCGLPHQDIGRTAGSQVSVSLVLLHTESGKVHDMLGMYKPSRPPLLHALQRRDVMRDITLCASVLCARKYSSDYPPLL